MADLERSLRSLHVEWPETPDVAARLELRARPRRRALVAAVAVAVLAVAAALAVPQSRSAILRFFHLRGVTVERVETLPPAEEVPLSAGLGSEVGDATASTVLGGPFLPADHGTLYERYGVVSTLLRGPILLSEFGAPEFLKKFATSKVEWVQVAPDLGSAARGPLRAGRLAAARGQRARLGDADADLPPRGPHADEGRRAPARA
jgi:hypothetical protein